MDIADLWSKYRQVVEHEDGLINQRFTWLLVSEGLLANLAARPEIYRDDARALSIAAIGLILAITFGVFVYEALGSIEACKFKWATALKNHDASEADKQRLIDQLPDTFHRDNWVIGFKQGLLLICFGIVCVGWVAFASRFIF